jgi:hypothetical protein
MARQPDRVRSSLVALATVLYDLGEAHRASEIMKRVLRLDGGRGPSVLKARPAASLADDTYDPGKLLAA